VSELGINLSFAVKRWPEPEVWCQIVREQLGLSQVQVTFDLLDPDWPEGFRRAKADRIRRAAADWDISIHSAFVGLAAYTYNGLLDPDPDGRAASLEWWGRAIDVAGNLGAGAVGGPLGAMSVADAADAGRRERLTEEMIDAIVVLTGAAREANLDAFLIEPTPLAREIPHTPEQASWLLDRLGGQVAVPVSYVIDLGHALYRPLYGDAAGTGQWFAALGDRIGALHLQNTDFQSDSHWGWPDDRGRLDVADFARELRDTRLTDTPVFLEIFYPFELADEVVLQSVISSVSHCREALRLPDLRSTRDQDVVRV